MTPDDFRRLRPWLLVTDLGMLAYWTATAANTLGWIQIPPAWLYSDYADPAVVAWNWSFLPIDLLFSISGLLAATLYRRGHPGWRPLVAISLGLTWCAGFQALAFWTVRCELDPLWWAANLFLVAWPMAFGAQWWHRTTAVTA